MSYADNPREWREDHPDGEFQHWHKCPYCENKFIGYSADECPLCTHTATPIEVGRDDKPF